MREVKTYEAGEPVGVRVLSRTWSATYVRALRVGSRVWSHEVELSSGRRVAVLPSRVVEMEGVES